MNLRRSHWQDFLYTLISVIVSMLLLLALVPRVPARATEQGRWSDAIGEMLAPGNYAEGEAIVALLGEEEDALRAQADLPTDGLEPLMEVSAVAAGVEAGSGLLPQTGRGVTLVLVTSDTLTTAELLRSLEDDPCVAFAEPNYYIELCDDEEDDSFEVVELDETVGDEVFVAVEETVGADEPTTVEGPGLADEPALIALDEPVSIEEQPVSDELLATEADLEEPFSSVESEPLIVVSRAAGDIADLRQLQWNNWDTTSFGTKALEALGNYSINVPNFETAEIGANMDHEVVVAVLDGPVDFTNPDLADRAYTFSPELQAQLGCDEHGFNASGVPNHGKIIHHYDFHGDAHGTHCAGIIGASWDGKGVSGVASNAKIVSVQLMGTRTEEEDGKTSVATGLRAFNFVKRANEAGVGIKVTSNSWGHYQVSKALNAAILELGESQGVVSIFAAHNDTFDNATVPNTNVTFVDNPYVIVVAASNQVDALAGFSNRGVNTVDIAAPGMPILSTVPSGEASYIPGASPDTDILFEDFEGSSPYVTVQQIDENGDLASSPGSPSPVAHYMGGQGVEVPVDPDCTSGQSMLEENYRTFRFDFDLEAAKEQTGIDVIQSLKEAQDLYLGFGICTSKEFKPTEPVYLATNASGDEELRTFAEKMSKEGTLVCMTAALADEDVTFDFDHLDGHLTIDVTLNISDECEAIYFDSIGIGTQKVPYAYMQGTSMACPSISGAAVVLSARTGLEGAELASLVRSMARIPDAGPLEVRTGGVFDFTVQGSPDDVAENALGPSISSLELDGTRVTITGSNFGSKPGSVEISRYIVGRDSELCASSITSWSDTKVTITLEKPFVGILSALLTNTAGKKDTAALFVSKGETVYEQDLPFTSDTGEPYLFDGLGDFETKGPLVGLGCKLYYLPADQRTEVSPVYQRMFCFDLKTETWSELPGLPEMLQGTSAVLYEGKLVVEGATVQAYPAGDPAIDFVGGEPEERVYVYDPNTGSWSQASSAGMYVGQTILNDNGQLKLVGATREEWDEDWGDYYDKAIPVCTYDLEKGLVEEICPLVSFFQNPSAVAKDGVLYITDAAYGSLIIVRDGEAQFFLDGLPETVFTGMEGIGMSESNSDPFIEWGVLTVSSDGVIFVGPPSKDGSTDTYILREGDGSVTWEPYAKRASEARVSSVAACTYRGRLFVIGSSWIEPEGRLFRATAMDVSEYPGDIPCEKDESTPTPTPSSKTSQSQALPKTDDPTISTPVLVGIGICGVAAVIAGIVLGRKGR